MNSKVVQTSDIAQVEKPSLLLEEITSPVNTKMKVVDQFIQSQLQSDIALISTISHYIIGSGGKRLRPVMLLLASGSCNNTCDHDIALAAIIEFIHTATLLHDDVVDASHLRRGQNTANDVWGDQASVLVGDFLYSRAFQQMVKINNMTVMDVLADTTNTIAEGEVLQLMNSHNAQISHQDYYDTIHRKTAILFQAACKLGAVITNSDEKTVQNLSNYGLNMGIAFQLIDDVLDYSGSANETGKNLGDDLLDGKMTLPLIRAFQKTNKANQERLKNCIEDGAQEDQIPHVLEIIHSTDAIEYTKNQAKDYTSKACTSLQSLPHSVYKQSMLDLGEFFIARVS